MSDISLNNVTSGYNLSKINANFQILEDAHNDVAAWISGGNNTWQQDIDLNSNDLLNVNSLTTKTLILDGTAVVPSDLGSFAPNSVGTAQLVDGSVTNSKVLGPIDGAKSSFLQAGTGAILRTMQDKARESVSILDFGGAGDGVTDNAPAWVRASAYVGVNGTVRLPGRSGTNYFFATDPNMTTSVIDPDPNVRISGNVGIQVGVRVTRPLPNDVALGQNFTHDFTPEFNKAWSQKNLWLADGDIDRSVVLPIDATSELTHLGVALGASDTFADATSQVTFVSSSQVTWGSSPADGTIRCSMATVRPGDEINFAFVDTGVYRRAAIIRTSAGYYYVYADGAAAAPHFGGKLIGMAGSDNTFTYEGSSTHPAYYPENGDWTIRIIDRNHFSVLINGLEVTNVQTVTGDIYQAGPGIGAIDSAKTINVAGFSRWRTRPHGGKRAQTILCIGDSLTDPGVHGGWPYAMREALAGSFGLRVSGLFNQAISGDNIAHQLSVLQTNGTQGASLAVIALGTNDAQFNSSVSGYLANLTTMVSYLRTNFCEPVMWLHPAFYEQTQSGGGGQATVNSGSGAYLRALILRFCADNNVKCIDMRNVSGAIVATWLITGKGTTTASLPNGLDPWVRDNIHPTTHAYKVMGYHIARAIAGLLNPQYIRSKSLTVLPATGALNSWTTSIQALQYSMSSDGMVTMNGVLNGGTITTGTVMYQLPNHLWPLAVLRFPCPTDVGLSFAQVRIDTAGKMYIDNAPVGTTFVDVSNITYQTAG